MEKIARVFPRKTRASPDDGLAFFSPPQLLTLPEIDEVHVSVAFTYDLERAEQLAEAWRGAGVPVRLGGPATGERGDEFTPGMYLKNGYVITSRGCSRDCWFCSVTEREGATRELPVTEGFNVLDDNLLACSESHIRAVFEMLGRQKRRPLFTGGLDARLLRDWHVDLLCGVRTERMYFAYDDEQNYDALVSAGRLLRRNGISRTSRKLGCYVLIGYPGDTFENAETRLRQTMAAGFLPYAMLYRDESGAVDLTWRRFQREWCNPTIVAVKFKKFTESEKFIE